MSDPIPPFDELPELTLSLRSFGSGRRLPNETTALRDEQDRFFAPLLESRRTAAQALTRAQVVAAFDARRIMALLDATLRGFAAERFASRAPSRRAFEAELFEIVDPLREALRVLGSFFDTGAVSIESREQYERWELWLTQLRVVFRAADSTWQPLCEALVALPRQAATKGRLRRNVPGEKNR